MKVDKIFVRSSSKFADLISKWAVEKSNEVITVSDKFNEVFEEMDSILIFNENQNIAKDILEIKAIFDKQQKASHKIDINGTLMVGLSNLELWIERTKAKRMYITGNDELLSNPNLERYLNAIK
jgi:hypothetical protein